MTFNRKALPQVPEVVGLYVQYPDGSAYIVQIDRPQIFNMTIHADMQPDPNHAPRDPWDTCLKPPPLRAHMTGELHVIGTVPQYEYRFGAKDRPEWIKEPPAIEAPVPEIEQ